MDDIRMIHLILLLGMGFMHVIFDFHQGNVIGSMKRKSWWLNHPEYKKDYEDDYKVVLFVHGFSWAFAINLPMVIYQLLLPASQEQEDFVLAICILVILANSFIHALIDDLKANKKVINLKTDQFLHMMQIILAWGISMWAIFN